MDNIDEKNEQLNELKEWANKRMNEQTIAKCTVTTQAGIFLFGFTLSEAELSCWKQSSRKPDLSQDTWGGEEKEGKQQSERESWFKERKEKLAAIWSLWVWLTASYWLTARTHRPVPGWTHSVVAKKSMTWAITWQDVFAMWNIRWW